MHFEGLISSRLRDVKDVGTHRCIGTDVGRSQCPETAFQHDVPLGLICRAIIRHLVPVLREKLARKHEHIPLCLLAKDTISIIIQETIKLLHVDRVSLFVYDKRIDMLVLNASNLEQPIRVKPGPGSGSAGGSELPGI